MVVIVWQVVRETIVQGTENIDAGIPNAIISLLK